MEQKKITLSNILFTKKFKSCPFSSKNAPSIDYKNVKLLEKYISEKGKIMPSRISFVSTSKQRLLSKAIKKARTDTIHTAGEGVRTKHQDLPDVKRELQIEANKLAMERMKNG